MVFTFQKHWPLILIGVISLALFTEPSFALTAGGGLPFDSYLTKIRNSVTGPFAFTASIMGLVGAGATLILGGDMNGVLRTLLFVVLVLSLLVAAENTIRAITGKGALIGNAQECTFYQGEHHGIE